MSIQKVATASENLENQNLEKLRAIFPEFVKDGEVDFDAIKDFFDKENILAGSEKYGLNWAGKSEAFKAIRVPATGTLVPDIRRVGEWEKTQNIFIEGDNLEVLKLLQKHYRDQIKMIYIDPPYNTGKDFIYKDNFTENKSDYYERTGQSEGGVKLTSNPESNGRYHSDWLTMMYPRLFLAKNLLKNDGVIFISIDDNEVANLRLIMDEIFGEENFEGHIHWRRRHNQPNDPTKLIGLVAEHILVYARNSESLKKSGVGKLGLTGTFSNPDNDPRGDWNSKPWKVGSNQNGSKYSILLPSGKNINEEWMGEEETYNALLKDGRIYFSRDGDGLPRKKIYKFEREEAGQSATNWFENGNFGNNQEASAEGAEIFDGNKNIFDNPKPVKLIKNLTLLGSVKDNEIVLDFFAGSGTTAQAVMEQNAEDGGNRKWICVQLPEETEEDSEARKAGYSTISEKSLKRRSEQHSTLGLKHLS
jgi:adenine-specific DNA-methyltransferase